MKTAGVNWRGAREGRGVAPAVRIWIVGLSGSAVIVAGLCWSVAILASRTPPDCSNPQTLSRARAALGRLLAPRAAPDLVGIRTLAGGVWAVRFVCAAEFKNLDGIRLPSGVLIHSIHYTSALSGPNRTQKVRVRLQPILEWQKVD